MTYREIRGIVGQLFLVLLSLLPMYILSAQQKSDTPAPPQKHLVESHPGERT
jgi:hypothetical protein